MKFFRTMFGAIAVSTAVVVTACDSSSTGPNNTGGSITLAVSSATVSVPQGGTGSTTATITRAGNFTGAVAITVEGLPANVTATAVPASIAAGSTTSAITFTAAAGATAGNSTVTIRAAGSGVTEKTATVTLTVTAVSGGSFTVALNPTSLNLTAGNQGNSTLTLTRTGSFAGNVTFSSTGAPAGMTVSFNPTSTTANTTTVTVATTAATAAGTYPIVIHGVSGAIDQVATLSVVVTASGGGGGSTTFRLCGSNIVFAAFQDGSGNWTPATITNGTISFNLSSGRGGVAYVTATGTTSYVTTITYGTQAELNNSAILCTSAVAGTKTVTGTVANVGQTEIAQVALGSSFAFVIPIVGTGFTLSNVTEGTIDLLASRGTQTGQSISVNKFIARYGLTPATGSVLPVLDFNAAEAQTPVQRSVTINGLSAGEVAVMFASFFTARGTNMSLFTDATGSNAATRTVPAVGTTQTGDLHLFQILAGSGTFPFTQYRGVLAYARDSNAKTFTLGPALGTVTVTTAATSPSVRLRTQYTIQPEYNKALTVQFTQTQGTTTRSVTLSFTAGYLNNATAFDQTMPELSTLTGWQSVWNLVTGVPVNWTLSSATFNGTGQILDGLTLMFGARSGTVTP